MQREKRKRASRLGSRDSVRFGCGETARSISLPSRGCSQDRNIFGREAKVQQPRIIDRHEQREDASFRCIVVRSKKEPVYESRTRRRHGKRGCDFVLPKTKRHDRHPFIGFARLKEASTRVVAFYLKIFGIAHHLRDI